MADVTTAEAAPSPAEAKEHKFPCKNCGADLVFAPGQEALECPYCKHVEKIPRTAEEIKEYSFNDYLHQPRSRGWGDVPGERRDVRCQSCGAAAQFDANVRAARCPFCGAPLMLDDDALADGEEVVRPEALVPFKISVEQAETAFHTWINSLWFAPGELKQGAEERRLHGVYRPFWTYDAHTVSHWTGERGDHYYVTETYQTVENGKPVTKTRQVRKTRWTFVSGIHNEFFDDILINGGTDNDRSTKYQLSGLKPYAPAYLSGFVAQRHSVACEAGWQAAKKIIADALYSDIRREIGGDEQRVGSIDTAYSGVTYKHILLPLWLSSYQYRNKTYRFQVNGQSGEVRGERPYSVWKIVRLVLIVLAVLFVIGLIGQALGK